MRRRCDRGRGDVWGIFLCVLAMAGGSQAHPPHSSRAVATLEANQDAALDRTLDTTPSRKGIGHLVCATRMRPREIAPRHFVLDRVTDCELRPVQDARSADAGRSARGEIAVGKVDSTDETSIEIDPARRATWSRSRDRLGNAQHASSLRAVAGGIRRLTR